MESITQIFLQRQDEKVSNVMECFCEPLLPVSSATYTVIAGGSTIPVCQWLGYLILCSPYAGSEHLSDAVRAQACNLQL